MQAPSGKGTHDTSEYFTILFEQNILGGVSTLEGNNIKTDRPKVLYRDVCYPELTINIILTHFVP